MSAILAAAAVLGHQPRFAPAAPIPTLRSVTLDTRFGGKGISGSLSAVHGLQGRVLWVDGTANLDQVGTDADVIALVDKAADAGFNTIIYDVKPIVGRTLYPSRYADQMTAWKGKTMPEGHDPLAPMVKRAKERGVSIYAALNAFSEGHSYAKRDEDKPNTLFGEGGWGYDHPDLQTWQYKAEPIVYRTPLKGSAMKVSPTLNTWDDLSLSIWTRRPEAEAVREVGPGRWIAGKGEGAEFVRSMKGGLTLGSSPSIAPIADDQRQIPLMMNPHDRRNQDRALLFVNEIMEKYAVDGIVYDDRLRFGGLDADFSPGTLRKFELHVGRQLTWPDDVYRVTYTPGLRTGIAPGPYFQDWLEWRALEMKRFVQRAKGWVKEMNPRAHFGVYAGSWYGDYARYGNNYASDRLKAGFPFLSPTYRDTGFARDLDFLITGAYYKVPTIYDALKQGLPPGRTVEAAGIITDRVAADATWAYAGIMLSDYWDRPDELQEAIQASVATTDGVMVFDYSHKIEDYWPVFRRAFQSKVKAPHQKAGLLEQMRQRRSAWDAKGWELPAFPILEGAPGTGF